MQAGTCTPSQVGEAEGHPEAGHGGQGARQTNFPSETSVKRSGEDVACQRLLVEATSPSRALQQPTTKAPLVPRRKYSSSRPHTQDHHDGDVVRPVLTCQD